MINGEGAAVARGLRNVDYRVLLLCFTRNVVKWRLAIKWSQRVRCHIHPLSNYRFYGISYLDQTLSRESTRILIVGNIYVDIVRVM